LSIKKKLVSGSNVPKKKMTVLVTNVVMLAVRPRNISI
jgi:hypothetical protein